MSLDTEEFGLDSKSANAEEQKEEELDNWDKIGMALSGPGSLVAILAIGAAGAYAIYFTKWGDETFYYSAMRDRTSRFGSEEGDFRSLDSSVIEEVQKRQGEMDKQQEVP